ncbi:MAG: PAS domain S-box protein, partial [Anaerolineales bacterium]|nr:PAS domain S-box protein [Anaerolineales bacterium]
MRQRIAELETSEAERKRAEEALRESEERFRMVLESSMDNLYRRDLETDTYDYLSPAVERISGYSPEEILSMPLESIVSMMHPDDIDRVNRVMGESMTSDRASCLLEYRFRHKDGQYRWLSDLFTVVRDAQGRPLYFVGNVRDITERKRAEEAARQAQQRYVDLANNLNVGVYRNSAEGQILEANSALVAMTEADSREELLKHNVAEFYKDPTRRKELADKLMEFGFVKNEEVLFVSFEGREIWTSVSAVMEKDEEGNAYVEGILHDITERKRAEEERRRLLANLEARNRELESFVYSVSHDLRAPLVSLDGFSHLLYKDFYDQLGDQGQHYLDRIQANVSHMNALISELLELARIGQVVGPTEEIDVAVLLREIQKELAIKLEEAGVELVVQEPLPTVHANRTRIRQVFTNLIENAIKFRSQERPLRIEVGCQQEGGFYRFHVADNGIGIAPQYHELIFAPFRRLDPQTEGVGMGLALVKKIVEHHGGRVWVESEEGSGATFYFTLPNP